MHSSQFAEYVRASNQSEDSNINVNLSMIFGGGSLQNNNKCICKAYKSLPHLLIRRRLNGPCVGAARLIEGTVIHMGVQGGPGHTIFRHLYEYTR